MSILTFNEAQKRSLNDALLYAAHRGDKNEFIKLVNTGADINCIAKNHAYQSSIINGMTPFLVAVQQGHYDLVRFLTENKIVRHAHARSLYGYPTTDKINCIADIHYMSDAEIGWDSNQQKVKSFNALILAAIMIYEHKDINQDVSANKNQQDWLNIITYLVRKGVDINQPNKEGKTPLFFVGHAEINNSVGVVNNLITLGADINIKDNNYETPYTFLCGLDESGFSFELFVHYMSLPGASKDYALAMIAKDTHVTHAEFEWLLDNNADPNAFNTLSLANALAGEKYQVALTLINAGANISSLIHNVKHIANLLVEADNRNRTRELLDAFLSKGFNVNEQDTAGMTCLMHLVSNENATTETAETIKNLLNNGANIKIKNNKGETAIDIAKNRKNSTVANLLAAFMENYQLDQSIHKDRDRQTSSLTF